MKSQLKSVFIFVFFLAVWVLIALAVEWQPDMGFKGFNSSLLLKEEIILADGTKLLKSADNKTMEIEKDGKPVFNITSTVSYNFIGDISISKEWEYKEAGSEFLKSDKVLIQFSDYICIDQPITEGNGLARRIVYRDCIYYPPYSVLKNTYEEIIDGEKVVLENKTNHRNITKLSSKSFRIDFAEGYDPIVTNISQGLVSCWSGDNETDDFGDYDFDLSGGAFINDSEFKLGTGAFSFNGTNQQANATSGVVANPFSISFWVYGRGTNGAMVSIQDRDGTPAYASLQASGASNTLSSRSRNSTGGFSSTFAAPNNNPLNSWVMYTLVYENDSHRLLYVNGTFKRDSNVTIETFQSDANEVTLGVTGTVADDYNGLIDNIVLFSRALNETEIGYLYNNSAGVTCTDIINSGQQGGADITSPTFTVYNESTTNSSSIVSSLASEAANSTWFIYNTTGLVYNVTNTSFGTLQSFFVGSLQNFTNYLVNLTRCDSSGNCATNRTFNFTTRQNAASAAVPDVASYINLSFPANNSVFTDPSWLNFSANGSGFHKLYNMTLYINNTRNASADKSVGGGVDYYIGNFSANISAGFYIWRVEIQNATGGFNISESRYFTVNFTDSVAPTFTVYNESTTNISTILSSLASEAANSTFRVYNDTVLVYNVTNTSFGTLQSFFVGSLSNGTTYWVNLTRCDSSGNCATNKTFNFTTRFNPPGSDITAPTFTVYNESTTNISTILSSLASEAANSTWWIYNATALVYNVSNASYGSFHSFFLGSLQNFTTYWVNLTRCDAAANCATNKTFNFTTAQNTNDSVAVSAASASPGGSFIQEIQEAQSKGLAEYILYILGKYPFTSFGVFVFFVILSERKYKRKTLVLKKEVFHVPKKDYNIN